jgi:ribosomal protein S27E
MTSGESSIKRFPCPQCGAEATFSPKAGKLKCDYCGWEDEIPQTADGVEERSYEQYLNTNRTRLETLSSTALEVRCNNCGASITFEPPQVAGQCPFCAAAIVSQPKLADPTLAPQGIVPFTLGRREARKHLQEWIHSRWFAPNALKELAQPEKIQGVYLPFWTYDAQTHSHYTGERGEYYYVTETYSETNEEGETETKTRQVRHTRWYSVSGRVSRFFDDILVPATQLVDLDCLEALEPWHLQESLRPYDPSYLAGFEAQRSQVSLKAGFAIAKSMMDAPIYSDVQRDIGGDEQRVGNISTSYSAITFKPILLPVWLTSYRYNNQQYQVLINARTGEVQGDRPYSTVKIILAVLAGILVAALIVGLIVFLSR